MREISSIELAGVAGGVTVSEAGANAAHDVASWGRAVWGRNVSAARFARDASMPLDQYQHTLERYDIPSYKPVIPTEAKW